VRDRREGRPVRSAHRRWRRQQPLALDPVLELRDVRSDAVRVLVQALEQVVAQLGDARGFGAVGGGGTD